MHTELLGSGAGTGHGGEHGVSGTPLHPGHLQATSRLSAPRGATSVVYSCQEKGTGAPYAAKILKKTVSVGGG